MKFIIQKEILKKFPEVKLGIVVGLGVNNSQKHQEISGLLNEWRDKQKREFADVELKNHERIAPWREAYSSFGAKPSKYSSSIESLLKRVISGGSLPTINPLVDLYNTLSLKHVLPFGAEDLDRVEGDIKLAFAEGHEAGKYIGGSSVDTCENGEVAYLDDTGFICRRWNWREADRTKILPETTNFVLVVEALPPVGEQELKEAINDFVDLAQRYLGGDYKTAILNKDTLVFETNFQTGSKSTKPDFTSSKQKTGKAKSQKVIEPKPQHYFGPAQIIAQALAQATGVEESEIHLDSPTHPTHGDYSSNIALKLKISPDQIVKRLEDDQSLKKIVSKIEVANGFINFNLSDQVLHDNLSEILKKKEKFGQSDVGQGKTVVIDYSSPNIAKRFGIGHLRSTIIGQALYNLYSFIGWQAIGDNHLGDWGTQFGVLIYMVEKDNLDPAKLSIDDWEKLYVDFHAFEEKNPSIRDSAREAFARLEKGDSHARKIWQAAYDSSLKEYDRIYKRLGVKIDYSYGESFYEDKMEEAIKLAKEKGVTVESEGALAIEFDKKYKLPSNLLVKSNGTTTYLTRDLALMFFRKKQWDPDLQIFEVGADQKLYFQQVFALAEMMGLFTLDQLHHVAHGMIRFKEGKMSTRKGKTIKLEEVLGEAVEKAKELGSESDDLAEKVGIGALKYNDLKRDPTKDIIFDWDEIINMEGNSGPYLQYTYARTQSVLRKSEFDDSNIENSSKIINSKLEIEETLLLRHLTKFPEIIISSAENFAPNTLCNYLYELTQKYNSFYNAHKIIGDENEEFRLALTLGTSTILRNGLTLLGIKAPERM